MPLQITGRHTTVTAQQKEYIDKKVDRLRRLCSKIDAMRFTLTKEKLFYMADATFRSGRIVAQATVSDPQPMAAIDALVDKIEAQVRKTKAKRPYKKGIGHNKIEREELLEEEEAQAEAEEIEFAEEEPGVAG